LSFERGEYGQVAVWRKIAGSYPISGGIRDLVRLVVANCRREKAGRQGRLLLRIKTRKTMKKSMQEGWQ
jgi:hypothetical protein